MSSCLVLQAKDKIYIGADTSSSVFIGNRLYRLDNNTKKLFLLDNNTVLYCAGNNSVAKKVVQHISSIYCRNDFSLISLKNWLVEKYPYKNKDKTIYDVEILIATFKDNKTIVYQMSQYKNYDIVSFDISDTGVQILSAGIKNSECMSFAEKELLNQSGVKSIFRTTFHNLSCNYIGGCLDLYEISKNGVVKIFDNERINEHGIQYVHDVFNDLSVSLNAEVLVSKLVMSENLWIENNSGNYKFDDNGFTATNGANTIKIQPNNSGELFSIYKGSNKQVYINSNGDVEFSGTLKSASGQFAGLISGGEINLGNGVFTVDKNGNMYSSSCTVSGKIQSSDITGSTISGGTISGAVVTGGTISGATIISSGTNGTTTISGGTIESIGASQQSNLFHMYNGNYNTYISPNAVNVQIKESNVIKKQTVIGTGMVLVSDQSHNTRIYPDSITAYKGFIQNCTYFESWENKDQAIPNIGWVKDWTKYNLELDYRTGAYGGRVYVCWNKADDDGISSCGWVKNYVANKIPNTNNFATKSDLSGYSKTSHNHTITPSKISPSSGSGTHNFMYNFSTYSGTNGFSYTYGYASGSLSDKRLKENIKPIEDISDKYMQLVPIQFNFHDDIECVFKGTHFGFIAQDVEKVFDDENLAIICREHQEDEAANKYLNGDDAYILDKDELHALHVQMIQKHEREIEALKQEINNLKEILNK